MPPKVLKSNILKKRQLTFAAYTHTHIWHGKPKEGNKKFALFLFIIYWQCGIKFSWRLKHSKCIDALDLEEIARMLVDVSRRHHQKTQQIKATLIFTKCVHELFVMGFLSWTVQVELHSMKQHETILWNVETGNRARHSTASTFEANDLTVFVISKHI